MKKDLVYLLPIFKVSGVTAMEAGAIMSFASIEGVSNIFSVIGPVNFFLKKGSSIYILTGKLRREFRIISHLGFFRVVEAPEKLYQFGRIQRDALESASLETHGNEFHPLP